MDQKGNLGQLAKDLLNLNTFFVHYLGLIKHGRPTIENMEDKSLIKITTRLN